MKQVLMAICLATVLLASYAHSDEMPGTIIVNGKTNCCASLDCSVDECFSNASKIVLTKGNYKLFPTGGAISNWASDWKAFKKRNDPWYWFVLISAGGTPYSLGSEDFYKSPEAAFGAQRHKNLFIEIKSTTTIHFWVEDMYKNKNYCDDNRGELTIGIKKLK